MAFTGNYTCDIFKLGLLGGRFDLVPTTTQVYKIALYTNAATLDASTQAYTTAGEVVAPGYTAGGATIVPTAGSLNGVSYISFTDAVWTAALTARGALIYRSIATVGNPFPANTAICVLDFGNDKTSTTTFTVQFPPATDTSAIIRIT